ncbi:MAG: ribosome-binding factor A [Parcubacteria group bacterium]|nr:ribosome-binding factor A [Parcubacteria group bacterium]
MTLRQEKLNALFKKLIAQFLSISVTDTLITVTECIVAKDVKNATAFIAIYPEDKTDSTMSLILEKQKELHDFLGQHTKMKYVPHLTFTVDTGEQKREKINKLLKTP